MNTILILPILLLASAGLGPEIKNRKVTAVFTHNVQLVQDIPTQLPAKKQKKQEAPIQSDEAAARVLSKMNVHKVTLTKIEGEGNFIEVRITEGIASHGGPDLQLIGNSGTTSSQLSTIRGFRDVSVPFEGRVSFRSASSVGMARIAYDREVRFEVTEVGRWLLHIEI